MILDQRKLAKIPVSTAVFESIDSTNLFLKRQIRDGYQPYGLVIAKEQTNGQGRVGKSFYSPSGTGLYLTFCFPTFDSRDLTPRIALACSRAIESIFPVQCGIKWVNDLYLDHKKIAGILCQRVEDYVLIGVGINLSRPKHIPDELFGRIGFLMEDSSDFDASDLILALYHEISQMPEPDLLEYKNRCIHLNQRVSILENGKEIEGVCVDISDDFSIVISTEGTLRSFSSGYVSLKI